MVKWKYPKNSVSKILIFQKCTTEQKKPMAKRLSYKFEESELES